MTDTTQVGHCSGKRVAVRASLVSWALGVMGAFIVVGCLLLVTVAGPSPLVFTTYAI